MSERKRKPRVMFNKRDLRFYVGGATKGFDKIADEEEAFERMPKVQRFQRLLKFLTREQDPRNPDWESRYLWEVCKFWPDVRVFIEDDVDLELTRNNVVGLLSSIEKQLEEEGYFLPGYVFELREIDRVDKASFFEDTGLSFMKDFKRD